MFISPGLQSLIERSLKSNTLADTIAVTTRGRQMKTPIAVEDIRTGDLIRGEADKPNQYDFTAMEYVADYDEHSLPERYRVTRHYLLERPEPPFEPYWGMVLGSPLSLQDKAAFLPEHPGDNIPWMSSDGWHSIKWAKQKLAEGWIEIKGNKND